jgi:sucrose-6-phosphate hydrolase SacC (GH32 family)
VWSVVVVVANVPSHQAQQMALSEHDDMVKQLSPQSPHAMAPKTTPTLGDPRVQHSERERAMQVAEILREGAPSGKWQVLEDGVAIWPVPTRAKEKK